MSRLADERGFTLVEVLVAATLFIIVLGATLSALTTFQGTGRVNALQNDSQEETRVAVDNLAKNLRNAGASTRQQPQGVDVAEPYNLVFQTVNQAGAAGTANTRNIGRVRYCLEPTTSSGAQLWSQTQTWTGAVRPPVPSTAACPAPGWDAGQDRVVARNLVNRYAGDTRKNCRNGSADACPVFSYSALPGGDISRISLQLYVDVNPGKKPGESKLDTAIYLRNANRAPTAAFEATSSGPRQVLLNASASTDAEEGRLTYQWFDNNSATPTQPIGSGLTLYYDFPAGTTSRSITLRVYDAAGYEGSQTQTVSL